MEVLIVSENLKQATYWERLIGLVIPDSQITCSNLSDLFNSEYPEIEKDLLFLVSIDGNNSFYNWIDYANQNEIPFICSIEQINEKVIEQLKNFAIKGYVNVHCSMDELETAIKIVLENKGTFLKFIN